MTSLYQTTTTAIPCGLWEQTDTNVDRERVWEVGILSKAEAKQVQICQPSFLSLVGVVPASDITENISIKIAIALFFSSIFSVWVSNFSLLAIFVVLSITNFLTSLIWDKISSYRVKISCLVAEFVMVAVTTTFAELVLGQIPIPFTQISISILAVVLYLIIISHLVSISKRLIPLTSLTRSKTLKNLIVSCKEGLDYTKERFTKRQEKEIFSED